MTWKHAVRKAIDLDESIARLQEDADELLAEWGAARGLTRVGAVFQERWNYGSQIGFGMYFTGEKLAAGVSRLQGWGCYEAETMRGAEEPWPPLDREPQRPSPDELLAAKQRESVRGGGLSGA
jgi:hypothetical protein